MLIRRDSKGTSAGSITPQVTFVNRHRHGVLVCHTVPFRNVPRLKNRAPKSPCRRTVSRRQHWNKSAAGGVANWLGSLAPFKGVSFNGVTRTAGHRRPELCQRQKESAERVALPPGRCGCCWAGISNRVDCGYHCQRDLYFSMDILFWEENSERVKYM